MNDASGLEYGDPINAPFWEAARSRRLVVQHCADCGHSQLYGRPFCLECESMAIEWRDAKGSGFVYSKTIVHVDWIPGFDPPYAVALVELDEGPRLFTNLTDIGLEIGDRVVVTWREREEAPPLPVFSPVESINK